MWPFTRKRRRLRQPDVENWRQGDVAECVIDTWCTINPRQPRRGSRAIVMRVFHGRSGVGLELMGYAWRWDASAFRKVVPDQSEAEPTRRERLPVQ